MVQLFINASNYGIYLACSGILQILTARKAASFNTTFNGNFMQKLHKSMTILALSLSKFCATLPHY